MQVEQRSHVVVRQAARRLVEDQHAAADGERARDLDELLRRRRSVADERVRRDVGVAELRERVDARISRIARAMRRGRSRTGSTPSTMFSITLRCGRERQLLVDHRDAGATRLERIARRVRAAVERIVAGVGRSAPARIAISVLLPAPFWPTSAQTSPARTDEVDAVERDGGAERLAHAAHLEARRASGLQPSRQVRVEQLLDVGVVHVIAA